jgi:beta-N-acetylhexosaminidase
MGAIKRHYDIKTVIGRILLADIDMALICHSKADMEAAFLEILSSQSTAPSLRAKAEQSVTRILALKRRYLGEWMSGES